MPLLVRHSLLKNFTTLFTPILQNRTGVSVLEVLNLKNLDIFLLRVVTASLVLPQESSSLIACNFSLYFRSSRLQSDNIQTLLTFHSPLYKLC